MAGSGSKYIVVPLPPHLPIFFTGPCGLPCLYSWQCKKPSRQTSARNQIESAFTTETPTPCKPPETLYESPPNFPPACKVHSAVSSADFLVFGCISTGIPRPSSVTEIRLSF